MARCNIETSDSHNLASHIGITIDRTDTDRRKHRAVITENLTGTVIKLSYHQLKDLIRDLGAVKQLLRIEGGKYRAEIPDTVPSMRDTNNQQAR